MGLVFFNLFDTHIGLGDLSSWYSQVNGPVNWVPSLLKDTWQQGAIEPREKPLGGVWSGVS